MFSNQQVHTVIEILSWCLWAKPGYTPQTLINHRRQQQCNQRLQD
jgi:hypothetical protein